MLTLRNFDLYQMAETMRNNHYYQKGSSSFYLIKGDDGHRNMQFVDPELAITRLVIKL